MKKYTFKKAVSVFMTGAIMLGFAGCLDFGGKKAALEAAETFASNVASVDADALIENSSLDEDDSTISDLLSDANLSDDQKAFCEAMQKTIEYEVDQESLTIKKGEASIDITFTIADYAAVLKEKYTKIDELTAAIKKADTKEIKFTAEFVKQDKEWVVDNLNSKKFAKIFEYRSAEIKLGLTPDMIKGFIDRNMCGFWLEKDGKITDLNYIEYNYYFKSEALEYKDRGTKIYFVLSKDDKAVFTSPESIFGETTNYKCKVTEEQLGLKKNSYLEKGNYKLDLYMKADDGDKLVDSVSVTVDQSPAKQNPNGKLPGEGDFYNFRNAEFKSNVIACGWLNVDNTRTDAKTYNTNAKKVVFTFQVVDTCTYAVDYKYYYAEKEDAASLEAALKTPIYSGSAAPKQFTNGKYIDLEYSFNGQPKTGTYLFVVTKAGTNTIVALGYCRVK